MLFCVVALLLLSGCGSKTYPVQGQVVFENDQPAKELIGYWIMFQSEDEKVGANGTVQADGSFTLSTFQPNDGAVSGKHRVAIGQPPAEIRKPQPPPLILARYSQVTESGLEVEIKPEKNTVTLKVQRLAP